MLKFLLSDESEFKKLDAATPALYSEDGAGRWVLQVDGAVSKAVHDTFRETNIELRKRVEAFGDITPELAKTLKAKQAEIEADKSGEKLNELVEAKVGAIRTTFETEKAALVADAATAKQRLAAKLIDAALLEAGTAAGLRSTATDDLIARGQKVFRVAADGESLEAVDADGNPVYSPGGEKLTPTSWVGQLAKSAAHLFEPSTGGGASGGGGGGGRGTGGANPWKKETWSLFEQSKMVNSDKAQARSMAAAAGVNLDI